jgi:hypothetical protein
MMGWLLVWCEIEATLLLGAGLGALAFGLRDGVVIGLAVAVVLLDGRLAAASGALARWARLHDRRGRKSGASPGTERA